MRRGAITLAAIILVFWTAKVAYAHYCETGDGLYDSWVMAKEDADEKEEERDAAYAAYLAAVAAYADHANGYDSMCDSGKWCDPSGPDSYCNAGTNLWTAKSGLYDDWQDAQAALTQAEALESATWSLFQDHMLGPPAPGCAHCFHEWSGSGTGQPSERDAS